MPCLDVVTNLPKSKIPNDFCKKASQKVAQLTSKPESYVQVTVIADQLMTFGGSDAPAAKVNLMSIGNIGGSKTGPLVAELTDFISAELGIPKNRYYISLHDVDAKTISFNGSTFA